VKQRGSFSITTLVLEATKNKRLTRTKIMQELVLSYSRTVKYLNVLVNGGLLQFDPSTGTFGITEKGLKVLQLSDELAAYLAPVNNMINKYKDYLHANEQYVPSYNI
jgi:predicted transcriptional regulator